MNSTTTEETQPQQPSSFQPSSHHGVEKFETHDHELPHQPYPSLSSPPSHHDDDDDVQKVESQPSSSSNHDHEHVVENEKWGTHIMGAPASPTSHPGNQKAALWSAGENQQPYLQYTIVDKPRSNPMEPAIQVFNSWANKTETLARNIWQNLKTGSSVSKAAWGKVGLTAKAITGGGFQSLYKQTFPTQPNEKLKKTFASYLSTSTGPVAGTLYLSDVHVAFCSDRPLSFTAPSGQEAWCYYKVIVALERIKGINPVIMKANSSERYIQISTIDDHDFWFMGFVNYDKACLHLSESMLEFESHQKAAAQSVVCQE